MKVLRWPFIYLCLSTIVYNTALAQTPAAGTATFQYQTGVQTNSPTSYADYVPPAALGQDGGLGYEFMTQCTGADATHYPQVSFYVYAPNDGMVSFDRNSTNITVTAAYLRSAAAGAVTTQGRTTRPSAGGAFRISSIDLLAVSGAPTVSLQAYNNGVAVGSATTIAINSATKTTLSLSANANFYNIDEIAITGFAADGIRIDNIVSSAAIVAPAAPAASPVSICGAGSITLTASGGSPAGGTYNWYATAVSTPALQSTSSTTYTTNISSTTTFYVSYTSSGVESTRTAVTATVNAQPILATAPTTPTAGLYFSYPFTGNANDVSGNSNTGTVQSAAALVNDRFGNANAAYTFNGSTQYVSTTTSVVSPGPANYTISVWFKTSVAGGKLVGFGSAQTGSSVQIDRHIYMSNTGQIFFGVYSGSAKTINTTATYADGLWHHAVATVSTTNGSKLYVDGEVLAADATMKTSQSYTGYWRIGYDNLVAWPSAPTSYYFNGTLDDIAVYNSELTPVQVYALYGAGTVPVCTGNPLTLQANTVAGATYAWSGPGGYTSTSQNPTVTASATTANAGVYTLVVTSASGCTSTIKVTAEVNALSNPVSAFTATGPVDIGVSSTVTYSGTYAATSTYSWNFNGGTIISGSLSGPYTIQWATSGTKTITLTVTNSGGCISTSTQTVVVKAAYSTYAYKIPLTLNTTGLGITTDLTNFPFLVTITDPTLVYTANGCSNNVQFPNGPAYDFAFVDAVAGEVPYQVESYDQTAGTLLVWVKLPTLTHSTNNTLSFYYGSATAPATHTSAFYATTWASDYQAVYHFNEASYTGSVTDATANGHTGTTGGMTSADLVTAKVGTGYTFNGSSKKITANAVNIAGSFTLSAWVKLSSIGLDQKVMTNQLASGGASGGYKLGVYTNNQAESESGTSLNRASTPTAPTMAASTWYYLQSVYSGAQLTTYVNGVQYKAMATAINPTSTNPFYIGVGDGGNSYYFNGLIDEARVSNVAKSSDWLLAEYNNQNNPSGFTTTGTILTNFTNASAIKGGIVYTTANGIAFTYTINSTTTSATPPNNGTASFIIAGAVSQPADAAIYAITVNTTNSVNLNGHTIDVGCNVFNNGTINNTSGTPSTVVFNGSAAIQTITATPSSTTQIGNLTVSNSAGGTVKITGGAVSVYNAITFTNGNLIIDNAGSGALTLKSTATQTAGVGALPAASSITGTVNVERYLTGGAGYRGYRLLSSPIYGSTVSSNNVYSLNYLKTSTYLTGTTGVGGGFDKIGNPTIYLFREDMMPSNTTFISGNFRGINMLGTSPNYSYLIDGDIGPFNIPVGNGFMFFFRGNRAATTLAAETVSNYVATTATLTSTGTLNTGQVIVSDWYTPASAYLGWTNGTANSTVRGFNLVGNPYASSIDWETFNTTTPNTGIYGNNIGTTVYELNPKTQNYDTYQTGGAFTNNGSRVIASGQGFFVQASSSTNPQLIFNETAKITTQNTGLNLFMGTQASVTGNSTNQTNPDHHLRLQLGKDSITTDDIYIGFNSTAKPGYIENEDAAYKPGTGGVSLSSFSSDNIALAINKLALPGKSETIRLKVNAAASGLYQLKMLDIKEIPAIYNIWLIDAYKKDSLDMRHNKVYSFDLLKSDTNSYGSHRFTLVIRQDPALNFHLLDFAAVKSNGGVQLSWLTENEQNYTHFSLERSVDNGVTFNVMGGFASTAAGKYSYLDIAPAAGTVEYRLKIEDLNGIITYSNIIILTYSTSVSKTVASNINIYPNPATATINLAILNNNLIATDPANANTQRMEASGNFFAAHTLSTATTGSGSYLINMVNSSGAIVKTATTPNTNWQTDVSKMPPGNYIIQVINNKDKSIVGKGAFIKL